MGRELGRSLEKKGGVWIGLQEYQMREQVEADVWVQQELETTDL